MKKLLLPLVLSLGLFLVGCDDDDKKDDSSSSTIVEKSIVVEMASTDVIDGDGSYQFDGGGWRVICTPDTRIYVQRESCSGLDKSNPESVRIGYTIFFKYEVEAATYIGSPNVAYARVIEAYRPECLTPAP